MVGGVGHTGGLTNPRPWRGRCRAGYSNTCQPPLPRKRAPFQKKTLFALLPGSSCLSPPRPAENDTIQLIRFDGAPVAIGGVSTSTHIITQLIFLKFKSQE